METAGETLRIPSDSTMTITDSQSALDAVRRQYTEQVLWQLEQKAGSHENLLSLTQGKTRGEVEFIASSLLSELIPEGSPAAALFETCRSCGLFDSEGLFDALEALPWGEES